MPAIAVSSSVTRANVDFAKQILRDRVGNDYVYGGNWSRDNTDIGTDCSGLVVDICDAVRNGPRMAWSRHGMSTESWRPIEVGQAGTIFNTICVAHPRDFPADAVVKIAIHHGPGGGANSHTWCEVDGMRGESNGSDGCVTGNQAMSVYDTAYANDWHYIAGPIVDAASPDNVITLGGSMAQIPQEQWDRLYAELTRRNPSRSPLRHVGEGPVDDWLGMDLNVDANLHVLLVKSLAEIGDENAIKLLGEVAANTDPNRAGDAALAKRILAHIEAVNPYVLQSFLTKGSAA